MIFRLTHFFAVSFVLLFLSGCAPKLDSVGLQKGLDASSLTQTIATMKADTNSQNEMWYWLDMGRLYQIQGDFNASIAAYGSAESILNEYENRATISLRNIGAGAGSFLFSKGAETYYGKGYDRTLMHTLNALNYAFMGDFSGAAVEMRKMERRQEFWLKESEEKIREAEQKEQTTRGYQNVNTIPSGFSMAAYLQDPSVRNMANNYQDAFSYALSAIVNKIAGNQDYAKISAKRAETLYGKSLKTLFNPRTKKSFSTVYVAVLSGEAPDFRLEKIRFPLPGLNYYAVFDIPSLKPPKYDISSATIGTNGTYASIPKLLASDMMAYKTLKDEMPYELTKALTRATTKAIIAKQASDKGGQLGGLAASLFMDVVSSGLEKGYRNWELLPNSGYLTCISAKKGENLSIILDGITYTVMVPNTNKQGMFVVVSYVTPHNVRIDYVEF